MCIIDEENTVSFHVFKMGFRDFQKWLFQDAPQTAFVAVENSNLADETFYTHKDSKGRLYTAAQARKIRGLIKISQNELSKISRQVGKNQAISQCVVDACNEKAGFTVFDISPAEKGKKVTDLKYFNAIMAQEKHPAIHGYKGLKSEQDKRDAYMLALMAKTKARYSRAASNR